MENQLNVQQSIGKSLLRGGKIVQLRPGLDGSVLNLGHQLKFQNLFAAQLFRRGRLIGLYQGHNDVTIEGKNHMLDVTFGNSSPVTQVDPWYIGLINQSPTPTLAEADVLASHAGWAEFTAYTGNRKAWDDANASAKIKGTTTTSDFTFSGSGSVHGIFVASVATGTSGLLWSTGSFDASVPVTASDVLRITYSVRL